MSFRYRAKQFFYPTNFIFNRAFHQLLEIENEKRGKKLDAYTASRYIKENIFLRKEIPRKKA